MQTFVVDGNFSAEHLKMRQPANDVSIADGHGFMVTDGPYKQHLVEANEDRQVGRLLLGRGLVRAYTLPTALHLPCTPSSQPGECRPP